MLTKKIHKQQRGALYVSIIWIAIGAFLVYLCAKIWIDGLGKESKGGFGLNHLLSSFLHNLSEQKSENLAKILITVILAVAFLYLLIQLAKSLRNMLPQNTPIGKSICRQMSSISDFQDLCRQIDNDMAGGYKEFGGTVFASSSWIFEDEAMCLKNVETVYDGTADGGKTVTLKDTSGNCLKFEFVFEEFAVELMQHLKKHLPTAKFITDGKESSVEEIKPEIGIMHSWHVQKTPEEVQHYKTLAEEGDSYAQTEYGKCLLFGKGNVTPDADMAYHWFKKAAAQSNETAKMYAGHCALYGIGTKQKELKGYKMLNSALEYNYPEESESQPLADYSDFSNEDLVQLFWDLGDALEKSLGVIQNYRVAVYYFNMMNEWGHKEGAERMSHYKKKGTKWVKAD